MWCAGLASVPLILLPPCDIFSNFSLSIFLASFSSGLSSLKSTSKNFL